MIKELKLTLRNIKKDYDKPVLKGISLAADNNSYIAIVGKSGSGKSTLMNILGLVESYDSGEYYFNNVLIKKGKDYHKIRSENIGFIFQSYNLIPTLTCRENIMLPLQYGGKASTDLEEIINELDIEQLLDKRVVLLSGGERQRIAIARALVLNPNLIIADEPTGNLDTENKERVLSILDKEHKKGRGVILITHDNEVARRAKKIYCLREGILHESL